MGTKTALFQPTFFLTSEIFSSFFPDLRSATYHLLLLRRRSFFEAILSLIRAYLSLKQANRSLNRAFLSLNQAILSLPKRLCSLLEANCSYLSKEA